MCADRRECMPAGGQTSLRWRISRSVIASAAQLAAAGTDRDTTVEAARADTATRIAAEAELDAAIGQARAQAGQLVSAAGPATRPTRPPGWHSRKPPVSAPTRTRCWPPFRADADLRARAERAERQADAYRDELTQLRAATGHVTDTTTADGTLPRARQATRP
jgi:hypothetical protein